jgi:hypothetical protein
VGLGETGCDGMDWIDLASGADKKRTLVNMGSLKYLEALE